MFKERFPHTFKPIDPPSLTESKPWYKNTGKRINDNKKNFSTLKIDEYCRTDRKSRKLILVIR